MPITHAILQRVSTQELQGHIYARVCVMATQLGVVL